MKRKLIISLCLSAMMALVSMPAMAQNKVTGNVVDENGEPVIGASITVVGKKGMGAVTDLDGNYTLNVPA